MHRWVLPSVAVLVLMAVPASAETNPPTAEDELAFSSCLADAEGNGLPAIDCAGITSDLCMETPDGSSTVGMTGCLDRELQLWDRMLNDRYQRLMSALDDAEKDALRDAQRAWVDTRDRSCAFEAMLWQGGTGGGPAAAGCVMRETAWRAIFLSDLVDFTAP